MKKILTIILVAVLAVGSFGLGFLANRRPVTENVVSASKTSEVTQETVLAPQEKAGVTTVAKEETPVAAPAAESTEPVSVPVTVNEPVTSEITLDDAKRIALEDAGVAESDAARLHGRLDYDDGRKIYDVEFYAGNTEYDYEILADTGEIYERNHETHAVPQTQGSGTEYIGVDQAKENAAGHAGVRLSDATFTKAKLEKDDGREEYEIEFFAGGREYDYVIEPYTGEILEAEID